jgi:hypothetical protein
MPEFVRSFRVDWLRDWNKDRPRNAVRALFARWALPGFGGAPKLRLGVRKNYINFYVAGQSVARLSFGRNRRPKVTVHEAYVNLRERGAADPSDRPPNGEYCCYDDKALELAKTVEKIDGWVRTAETYAGDEKRFVDRLIAANPGVIDLEMGLPAGQIINGKRAAPRMDLVLAQAPPGDAVAIAFWEVKCSTNSELRAGTPYKEDAGKYVHGPKVIHQVRKYVRWMNEVDRRRQVQCAYRATAKILLGFYNVFGTKSLPEPACVGIWRTLEASQTPELILAPWVVIGNYCPSRDEPSKPAENSPLERNKGTFVRDGHRKKLENHGIKLREFDRDDDHVLPAAKPGTVTA